MAVKSSHELNMLIVEEDIVRFIILQCIRLLGQIQQMEKIRAKDSNTMEMKRNKMQRMLIERDGKLLSTTRISNKLKDRKRWQTNVDHQNKKEKLFY